MTELHGLDLLGWDSSWAQAFAAVAERQRVSDHRPAPDLMPGRVVRVDRGLCLVSTGPGQVRASFGGEVLDAIAVDTAATPCTGDWCAVRDWPDGPVTVEAVLTRRTAVVRADVNGSSRGQVLVANLDVVAVVTGLHPEPVIGKLERALALAWESGARPVVVLTKADLVNDADEVRADVAAAAPGVEVIVCSATTGEGVDLVRATLGERGTMGLLGSSGAGKSTLVNALVGTEVLATREIRADGRGRHTSVRRELIPLPGGGAVIDTPGLRGIGLIDADGGIAATFADVEELIARCRFNDCSHSSEPGCAVLAGVEEGRLPLRRLESWRKLQREMAWMATRSDARLRAERSREWKQRSLHSRRAHRDRP